MNFHCDVFVVAPRKLDAPWVNVMDRLLRGDKRREEKRRGEEVRGEQKRRAQFQLSQVPAQAEAEPVPAPMPSSNLA